MREIRYFRYLQYFDTEEESKSIRYMIDSNEDFYNFYEHNFLNGLIYKYMIGIKQVNGDDFQKLFRKETLFEHLIAEIFFYFGHDCLIKSFVEPFKRLISNLEENSVCMSILENMKGQKKKKNDAQGYLVCRFPRPIGRDNTESTYGLQSETF